MTTVLAISLLGFASALPTASLVGNPRIHNDSVSSTNWSGFAVTGPAGSVSDAKGSWVVPTIQGTCPSTNQFSSFWVGIDGYSSGTVEQTGTDSDCQGGVPTYYAWFEFFPHPLSIISGISVHSGDIMSAEVHANGRGSFTVSITDTTSHQSFSTSSKVNRAQASSAEWIAEAPSSSGGILPLANFGTAKFGSDNTGIASTCFATISGTTGAFNTFANVHQITMVSNSGTTKASPSNPSVDGSSFSVTWVSSGP
jgi:Peptidase A4 family